MIAYDKTLLDNVFLDEEAHHLKDSGFISTEQYKTFSTRLPKLKSQNTIFIRIGFFILGSLLYSSISGFISLIAMGAMERSYLFFLYLFAIIGFGTKEFMSKNLNHFGSGLDDAFILGGIGFLMAAIGLTFEHNYSTNILAVLIIMAIASSFAYLRYLNLSLALYASIGITGSIGYAVFDYLIIGKAILPFVLLIFSGCCYFIASKTLDKLSSPYYYNGLKLVKAFCLIVFYLAGNYFVVRELNATLSEEYYAEGMSPEIPFAFFFWIFTFSIPLVYLFFSLKNKDRMMLWIGSLALFFSFFTFRTYYHVLPPEVALTAGGLVLFALTYFAIKKTKFNETGITFKVDRFSDSNAFSNLQTLVVASQFGLKPETEVSDSPMEYGDGGFSGGGSGGEF